MTTIKAHVTVPEKIFAASGAQFDRLTDRLQAGEALTMTHSEVEDLVWTEGMELFRLLFQDHLDLRSSREVVAETITGTDGIERTHHRVSGRALESVFGTVRVSRVALSARGAASLHPMDRTLNLPADLFSFGVRRRAAEAAAQGSFGTAVATLAKTTGAHVANRQLEELAISAARDFDAFYTQRATQSPGLVYGSLLILSTDGKGVVMRHDDLREDTRKKAEQSKHKLNKRLSPGEKANRTRMATVAAVYAIGKNVRTVADIVDDLRRRKRAEKRPRPHDKRIWASVDKDAADVIREAFVEAQHRDPHHQKTWVAVVDGNEHQIETLQALAKEYDVQLTIVLDLIHVIEYVWKAARVLAAPPEIERWVTERLERILTGEASLVAGGMRRSATCRGLDTDERKPVDKCANYLLNHADFMRYQDYLAAGFPIASGVIEGACRHLVQDRLGITGARWGLAGAEAILRLRALRSSGDFEEYWRFHEAQEAQRNHAHLFALPLTPHNQRPLALAAG